MVARDPGKPKTSDISDVDMLAAVSEATFSGVHPADHFPHLPGKLSIAKLRKLEMRGLVSASPAGYFLTPKGREALGS